MPRLCPRGRKTAEKKFMVYPSAYANGYAVQVCKGMKPDYNGEYRNDYMSNKPKSTNLGRWYQEEWVDVCNHMAPCGRKRASVRNYPYCRPLHKLPGTKVKTVSELTPAELKKRCQKKRKSPFRRVK